MVKNIIPDNSLIVPAEPQEKKTKSNTKYCAYCEEKIPLGKEIKIFSMDSHNRNNQWHYCHGTWRWTYWSNYDNCSCYSLPNAVFYLCPSCYRIYRRQIKKQEIRQWKIIIFIFLGTFLFILLIFLFIYLSLPQF